MLLVTTETISGKELQHLGLVQGNVVNTKDISSDFRAAWRTITGGEINDYTDLLRESRAIATERMVAEANALGADAIVCVRYATSDIMDSASEVMVCGTAVKFI